MLSPTKHCRHTSRIRWRYKNAKLMPLHDRDKSRHSALTKLNTAWDLIGYNQCLPNKTRGWWELAHWSISHNKRDLHRDIYQPGGMAVLITNKATHWATQAGDDGSGLGRWSWVCLWGKQDRKICIISLYWPCPSCRHLSTNQQHICWFSSQGKNCKPWDQIFTDLIESIQEWQMQGNQVIVVGNWNKDVCSNTVASPLKNLAFRKW